MINKKFNQFIKPQLIKQLTINNFSKKISKLKKQVQDLAQLIFVLNHYKHAILIDNDYSQSNQILSILLKNIQKLDTRCYDFSKVSDVKKFFKFNQNQFSDKAQLIIVYNFDKIKFTKKQAQLIANFLSELSKSKHNYFIGTSTIQGHLHLQKYSEIIPLLNPVLTRLTKSDLKTKNIHIIGASSFFGTKAFNVFEKKFQHVFGTEHTINNNTKFVPLDITSEEQISAYFQSNVNNNDIVLYTAGFVNVDGCEEQLTKAQALHAEPIKKIAKYFQGKFVYISSDYVYNGDTQKPNTLISPPSPVNNYGKTKIVGEKLVLQHFKKTPPLIIRCSKFYGYNSVNDKKNALKDIVLALEKNEEKIIQNNSSYKGIILIDNLATTIEKLLAYQAAGIFQVSEPEKVTMYDLSKLIAEIWSRNTYRKIKSKIIAKKTYTDKNEAQRPVNSHFAARVDTLDTIQTGITKMISQMGKNKPLSLSETIAKIEQNLEQKRPLKILPFFGGISAWGKDISKNGSNIMEMFGANTKQDMLELAKKFGHQSNIMATRWLGVGNIVGDNNLNNKSATLSWQYHGLLKNQLFGKSKNNEVSFIGKILDSAPGKPLSLSIHVDFDEFLHAFEDGYLYCGLKKDITAQKFKDIAQEANPQKLLSLLNRVKLKKNQTIVIPRGTFHAYGDNFFMIEGKRVPFSIESYQRKNAHPTWSCCDRLWHTSKEIQRVEDIIKQHPTSYKEKLVEQKLTRPNKDFIQVDEDQINKTLAVMQAYGAFKKTSHPYQNIIKPEVMLQTEKGSSYQILFNRDKLIFGRYQIKANDQIQSDKLSKKKLHSIWIKEGIITIKTKSGYTDILQKGDDERLMPATMENYVLETKNKGADIYTIYSVE